MHPSLKQAFVDLIPALKGWRCTVDSATQPQQLQRHLDEADNIITPKDMQQLRESRPYTEGTKLIIQAGQGKEVTLREFAEARDVLLVRLTLATGTRPGPLNNATMSDYESAKTEEGKKIILVAKHKRSKDGPAILGMDEELQVSSDSCKLLLQLKRAAVKGLSLCQISVSYLLIRINYNFFCILPCWDIFE